VNTDIIQPHSRPSARLSRAQVHTAFGKLQLTPAVNGLAKRLLNGLDDDGSVSVQAVHAELFPLASTASASAQLSKLLKTLTAAALQARFELTAEYEGEKKSGVAARRLRFLGPRPTGQADTEGLDAIPPAQLISGQQGMPLWPDKRVVLLTFNDHEFAAVTRAFLPPQAPPTPSKENGVAHFRLGQHGGVDVFLCHSAQGNRESQRTVSDLCAALKPLAVVAVGVAFGADQGKQNLGDVLVSSFICDYETAKVHDGGRISLRGPRPPAARVWVEAARQVDQAQRNGPQVGTWPTLHIKGVLSGEKLVDDIDYRNSLKALAAQDDIAGGEMEAAGLFKAVEGKGVDWFVIKAICDFADGQKGVDKDQRQTDAAHNAAQVAKALFDSGLVSYADVPLRPAPQSRSNTADERELSNGRRHMRAHVDALDIGDKPVTGQHGHAVSLDTLSMDEHRREASVPAHPKLVALDDILQWATRTVGDEQPLYALLGEYGMGKTTTCQRAYTLLREQREQSKTGPIAHYFDLRKVELAAQDGGRTRVPTLAETITDCLRHGYLHEGGQEPRYEDVLDDIQQGAVIFFDGLDEVLARLPEQQGLNFTANLLKVLPEAKRRGAPVPRVLLSCRTQFFRNLREQHSHLGGEHRGGQPATQFRALVLLPFGDAQVRAYLQGALPQDDPDALLKQLGEVHNLLELAERPFLLKLVTRFIPQLEQWRAQGRTVTGATLYREMVREWLVRDKAKQSFQPEDKEQLAADLAAHLWRQESRGLTARELESWLGQWLTQQDPHAAFQIKPRELLHEDLRNSTFLMRNDNASNPQDSRFEFAHTSLLEFFLAQYLLTALREGGAPDGPARQRWVMTKPSDETLDFLGQMLAEDASPLQGLNRWNAVYLAQASELQLAYSLRAWQRGWPRPNLQGIDLRGAQLEDWHFGSSTEEPPAVPGRLDMRGARFEGAVLRRARFWQVDLQGASFLGAAWDQGELLYCELEASQWDDARLGGCRFWPPTTHDPIAFAPGAAPSGAVLTLATGHGDRVNACAISEDGCWVISGSHDCAIRLWDASTGHELRIFKGHHEAIRRCLFSPDGLWILSASDDCTLRLWNTTSGKVIRVFEGHQAAVWDCAFSPDCGMVLSISHDNSLRLWEVATGRQVQVHQGETKWALACAFSPAGKSILAATRNHTLELLDVATGERLRTFSGGHSMAVFGCAFSPDGQQVLSVGDDGLFRMWDVASGQAIRDFQGALQQPKGCAFSPDGSRVLAPARIEYGAAVRVWNARSGEQLLLLNDVVGGWNKEFNSCTFSSDNRTVVAASFNGSLQLWDAGTGHVLRIFARHTHLVTACAFSLDGRWTISAGHDGAIRVADARTGQCVRNLQGHKHRVTACAFLPDSRHVLSASFDGTIRLWDIQSEAVREVFRSETEPVFVCRFSQDRSRIFFTMGSKGILTLDVASGHAKLFATACSPPASLAAVSSDGRWLLIAQTNSTALSMLDARTGQVMREFIGHGSGVSACQFSADGRWVFSGAQDGMARLWDSQTGEALRHFVGHKRQVNACVFAPDDSRVLSCSDDCTLRLWDAWTGLELRCFEGHHGAVTACAFSPDGHRILSSANDGTMRLWDTATGRLIRNHLHAPNASAAWHGDGSGLIHASGAAWRYLRWWGPHPDHNMGGSWPLECPPPGQTVVVQPWAEVTANSLALSPPPP
jgi:WD40 repeat protein/nucleoside phosphorylase